MQRKAIALFLALIITLFSFCACLPRAVDSRGGISSSSMPEAGESKVQVESTAEPKATPKAKYTYPEYSEFKAAPADKKPMQLPAPEFIPTKIYFNDPYDSSDKGDGYRFIYYLVNNSDKPVVIPAPAEAANPLKLDAFVVDGNFIAMSFTVDNEIIYCAISRDNGENWDINEIAPAPPGNFYQSISFINENLGWFSLREYNATRRMMLYKTVDGGKTWKLAGFFNNYGSESHCCFATEDIGWVSLIHEEENVLLETVDGGESWYILELAGPGGKEKAKPGNIPVYSLICGWTLEDYENRLNLYVHSGESGMWEKAENFINLPANIGSFTDFEQLMNFYCPAEYNWQNGYPTEEGEFLTACNTCSYITKNYGEEAINYHIDDTYGFETPLLSPEQINEYVYYQFNDASFDATKMPDYDAEAGGVWHYCAHGGLSSEMRIAKVNILENDDVELYFDVFQDSWDISYYTIASYYYLLRPATTPGGLPISTVLESRPLTPLPIWASLFYSI